MPWRAALLLLLIAIPVIAPLVVRRRIGTALIAWPFAAILVVTLPVIMAAWRGEGRSQGMLACAGISFLLGGLIEGLMRLPGSAAAPANRAPTGHSRRRRRWIADGISFAAALYVALWVGDKIADLNVPSRAFNSDAYAIWFLKARILAAGGAFRGDILASPELVYSHSDYPLGFPALLAWFLRAGHLDVMALRPVFAIGFGALSLAAWGAVRIAAGPLAAAIAVPALIPLLGVHLYLSDGVADPWCAYAGIVAMALALSGAAERDRARLLAGSLALAACITLKNEGMPIAILVSVAAVSVALATAHRVDRSPVSIPGALASLTCIPIMVSVAWRSALLRHGIRGDLLLEAAPGRLVERRTDLDLIAGQFGAYVFDGTVITIGVVIGLLVLLAARRGRDHLAVSLAWLLPGFGMLLVLLGVYVGSAQDPAWLIQTSLDRTIRFPVAALFLAALCQAACLRAGGGSEPRRMG